MFYVYLYRNLRKQFFSHMANAVFYEGSYVHIYNSIFNTYFNVGFRGNA